ncbi:Ppx/GppA phosphatase family protein [Geobacter sp. AOG1]|uniref:Ppx/GppA phosphatase family protein n=1 Tax=Geobacter sp. AOG1 TaxID=1566346 RepID=UPI001CC4FAB0|nr:Ppx/GppA phosphatase family protein [Geobacter sp. AOG1]GFE57921.1 exopolyphosphatase [Geobacter sp. AOG1]
MRGNRLAAIDIGTNSIRSIVVEVGTTGTFRILDDEKATVRLGEGFAGTGAISPAAWQRAMDSLSRMRKIFDGYGVKNVEAVATSAVRKATNGPAFVDAIKNDIGIDVTVIDGEEEAELAVLSAQNNFDMEGMRYAMVDIGGGSLEIVTALGNHIEEIYSLELGAVVLTEKFIGSDPVSRGDYSRLRKHVRKTLKEAFDGEEVALNTILGSGGTMTAIAAMVMAMRREGYGSIHGYEVLRSEVVHLLAMLLRRDMKGRRGVAGLNPDRADIIVAGVVAVDELMDFFGANMLKVNERGIREGLILRSLKKHRLLPASPKARSWRQAVLDFARSCHFDEEHSLHVARLALQIFDPLAGPFKLGKRERQLLESAALLHDIGYFISYSRHHKHSYHLIRHADLFGFTPREMELIANIARYHRKSLPKKKHESFARLAPPDQLLVNQLGGILRLADGLDRRRNSFVEGVECNLSPAALIVRLTGGEDLSVELFGGKLKGDLMEAAFKRKLQLVPAVPSLS